MIARGENMNILLTGWRRTILLWGVALLLLFPGYWVLTWVLHAPAGILIAVSVLGAALGWLSWFLPLRIAQVCFGAFTVLGLASIALLLVRGFYWQGGALFILAGGLMITPPIIRAVRLVKTGHVDSL
jgi:hypothetical protein